MARASPPPRRRRTVALLLGLALAFCLPALSIQSSFFTAPRAASRLDLDADEVRALSGFQSRVQQCVDNGSDEIFIKAMRRAINKTVAIVELLKRRIVGLRRNTTIESIGITGTWELLELGRRPTTVPLRDRHAWGKERLALLHYCTIYPQWNAKEN